NVLTPLNTRKRTPRARGNMFMVFCVCLLIILLPLFLAQNLGLVRCPLDDLPAEEKARLRRHWQRETAKWTRERGEHAAEVRTWEQQRSAYAREQRAWEQERGAHAVELRQWDQERAARREEHREEEEHRLEAVRRSQGVYWTEPAPGDCHTYGTRTYSANLKDIPKDLSWSEVCDNMPPVVIHGRNFSKPIKCERNFGGNVVGTWYINFDEPSCKPYWNDFSDLGCNLGHTGFQRFAARLDGMSKGADWNLMCSTTPATIHGAYFTQLTTCEDQGRWGEVGLWDVPNPTCH
ncbi:hypothetical protein TRAPUB_538, partial [Trametes pubescens]